MTSLRKLRFDLLQIQYLLSLGLLESRNVFEFIENYESILGDFTDGGSSNSHVSYI